MYTIKELNEMSNITAIKSILQDKANKLSNVYSPLSIKIKEAQDFLDNLIDEEGSENLTDLDLEAIAMAIKEGNGRGRTDGGDYHITWELTANKWSD